MAAVEWGGALIEEIAREVRFSGGTTNEQLGSEEPRNVLTQALLSEIR